MKRSLKMIGSLRRFFRRDRVSDPEEDEFITGELSVSSLRDRSSVLFRDVIGRSLRVWRENPLARRIVCLTTQFSVGRGFRICAEDPGADELLREFWEHPLNRQPPAPGRILVTDAQEEWTILHPNLDSSDANEDGLAIKKLIAAGAGIPISFLAENAGSSRAENGGMEDSACRNFRQRQQTLMFIIETVLRHVLARGAHIRPNVDPFCEIHVYGDDISAPGMSEGGMVRGV